MNNPAAALLRLLALSLLAVVVVLAPPHPNSPPLNSTWSDVQTYREMVSHLRAGEPYHVAVGGELRRRGYSTKEIFHWRTPLLMTTLAFLPDPVSHGLLVLLGTILIVITDITLRNRALSIRVTAAVMQIGAVLIVGTPVAVVLGEVWAGLLIGLSVCASLRQRPQLAVGLGLLALFVRELAAPYAVVCASIALMRRQWAEVRLWGLGVVGYAVYYGWHVIQIRAHQLPGDRSAPGWLALGGLSFLATAIRAHAWTNLAPAWVIGVVLALITASILDASSPAVVRATSGAYVALFWVAGKPFDWYWGFLAWPTWALACGFGLAAIVRDAQLARKCLHRIKYLIALRWSAHA
jgi:hypothetical protein